MTLKDSVGERVHARVGSVLRGKWRIDSVIGVGGMASVFAATHRNQSRVAIKMLHPEVGLDAEVTARFLREGYVANAVGHPGTVAVLDDDVAEDGAPFLVMELLEGETLDEQLERGGALSFEEAASIGDQVLDVLAAAHEKQVVHRDIKPENLFVMRDSRVKVLDFGIARLRELSFSTGGGTRAGAVLGTPAFMAPEQALGHWDQVDGRTDIWAVGATLYTLLTGRYVHEADTLQGQLVLAATRRARLLDEAVSNAPTAFAAVIDRALAFERDARWPDARVMQSELRKAAQSSSGRPLTLGPRRSLEAGFGQNPTVVAPDTQPGHGGSVGSFATAQAVSRSTTEANRGSPLARYVLVAGACLLVALAVVALRPPRQTAAPASEPPPQATNLPARSAAVALTVTEEPKPVPKATPPAAPPATASAKVTSTSRHPTTVKTLPPLAKTATVSFGAPPAKTAKGTLVEPPAQSTLVADPFDRRH